MTQKEFYDYLLEFLTLDDVKNLESYALESVKDVSEDITDDCARDHVIEMIQCGDLNFEDLESIFQREISEDERKNMEWRF